MIVCTASSKIYPALDQIVFTRVRNHLLSQAKVSVRAVSLAAYGEILLPAYRDPEGNSSSIGCLISDEDYDPAMEGIYPTVLRATSSRYWTEGAWALANALEHLDGCNGHLLYELQSIHNITPVNSWRTTLELVARRFALEWEPEPVRLEM